MSAIVGIYHLDRRPVDPKHLEQMGKILSHRGPDGAGLWYEGSIGLGHRLLWTTPESLHEYLPLTSQTDAVIITADARLDNRRELWGALELRHCPAGEMTDSQLILAAYETWGEHCPEHLLGDFAFAIWDRRTQMLFCARDHFGVRPFYYYYQPGRLFAFASEIKALWCLPAVPRRLNEVRVADYLADLTEDKTMTFFRDIVRLPPAHRLAVGREGIALHPYWVLDHTRELILGSDEEYASGFREVFTEAVRSRLRSAFPVGSHLSGGLDSSAVTCVARDLLAQQDGLPLQTFSNIFDDVPQCDERPYIKAVLDQGGLAPRYIHADQAGPLADLERVLWHEDEPCIGPNHFLPWGLNRAAQQQGVRVVLDGFDGDTTVSHGAVYFTELARRGDWKTFAAEAEAVSKHFSVSPISLLERYGLIYLEELATQWRWLAVTKAVQRLARYFEISRRDLLLRYGLKPVIPEYLRLLWGARLGHRTSNTSAASIINPNFAKQLGIQERLRTFGNLGSHSPLTVREDQWRSLTSGLFTIVLELSDRCAAAFFIEARHPFLDKRLVEFCLALPPEQKLNQGWSRLVMRRALANTLPEEVQWRSGKTDMNHNFVRGLLTFEREHLDEVILHKSAIIADYVDTRRLREVYRRFISTESVRVADAMTVWKGVTLAQWLLYTGLKP